MGLREKVALTTIAMIASRILCSCCMPRDNYSITNHAGSLKAANKDSTREININKRFKKTSLNSTVAVNESKNVRFPEVEYPSSCQVWDYYRFQNDYTQDLKSKVNDNIAVNSPQARNAEREAKHKRKVSPVAANNDLEYDPAPQPYCFKKSSFFPEIDYPMSARDMWIPTYWNRHLDTERDCNTRNVEPVTRIKKQDKLEICPLNDIMNTVNANNKMPTKSMKNNIYSKVQKNGDTLMILKNFTKDNIIPTTQSTTLENCESVDVINLLSTPAETNQTTLEPHLVLEITAQNEPDAQEDLTQNNNTPSVPTVAEIYLPHLTTETLPVTLPITISTEACIMNNDLLTPPYGTTVPMLPETILENNTSVTIPKVVYFDANDATTASPLECLTPTMPKLDTAADEYIVNQTEKTTATTQAPTTICPEFIISSSTISSNQSIISKPSNQNIGKAPDEMPNIESTPSVIADASYMSPSDDILLMCTDNPKTTSVICLDGLNENWVFSSNDSYITWESFPEYSDDWIILVDTKNCTVGDGQDSKKTEQVVHSENPAILCEDNIITNNASSCLDSLASDFGSPSSKLFSLPDTRLVVDENTTNFIRGDEKQSILDLVIQESTADADQKSLPIVNDTDYIITFVEETNPTLQYSDDNCAPYTESPDGPWATCPESANDICPTSGDDPYVIYQPISEYTDEDYLSTLLNTEKTT